MYADTTNYFDNRRRQAFNQKALDFLDRPEERVMSALLYNRWALKHGRALVAVPEAMLDAVLGQAAAVA